MSRDILIGTPENIAIEYELAGLGARFTANCADTLLQLLIYLAVIVAALLVDVLLVSVAGREHWSTLSRVMTEIAEFVTAGAIILSFIVFWGYYIFYEYRWNGQTPGKRMVGIRVIREGGYPVDFFSVLVRTLMRVLDFLPTFYFIGIASILCSRSYQRLGDILGGTIVVKQRAPRNLINLLQSTRLQPEHLDREALALMQREADRLTPEQYQAVRHFTERRRDLVNWNAQQDAAKVLAIPLMERLHIVPPRGISSVNYADVLEYLAVAYEAARRPKETRPVDSTTQHTNAGALVTDPAVPIAAIRQGVSKHQ
jgi:uncharacterized RDD family membrane protein YckC